jgi:DNA invertase Pin-like site-specific DNA recombinase
LVGSSILSPGTIRTPETVGRKLGASREARSLQGLIGFLSELHSLGIDLALHQQGIDTTMPAGKAMFQMMGVVAEFARSRIVERVRES